MKQLAIFLFASFIGSALYAQDLRHEGDVNKDITPFNDAVEASAGISTVTLNQQAAWKQFNQHYPSWGATFSRYTKLPHRAFGQPITYAAGGSDAVAKATSFIQNEFAGFNLPVNELLVTRNFNDGKYINVDFKQKHDNYEILWSRVTVRFSQDLKIVMAGIDMHRNIPALSPTISPAVATQKAKDALTTTITGSSVSNDLKIFPLPVEGKYEYHLVYQVTVNTRNFNNTDGVYLTYVDANTGDILYRQNQVKFFDAKVKGDVRPVNFYSTPENRLLKNLKVKVGTTTYYTDSVTGIANLPSGANATISLDGRWVKVLNAATSATIPASYVHTFAASGDSSTFDVTATNANDRGVNVYYHVNAVHDFMKTKYPGFTDMDNPLPANVDASGTCNANYNGGNYTINFLGAGTGCTAFSYIGDVMSHEYGHGISDKFYSWQSASFDNGAMGEGYSDTWANCILKTGIIGFGYNTAVSYIRRYDNTHKVYPQDITGEVHDDGEIIAGAWWDVGMYWNSIDSMGDLFAQSYFGLATGPDGTEGTVYHDILIDALTYDDNNANLSDGTPHFSYIVQGFADHGIYLLSNTVVTHNSPGSIIAATPITITADASADFPVFLGDLRMIYRKKGTTISDTIVMTKTGTNYTCQFPSAALGDVYEYIFAVYDYTNVLSLFSPANAAFNTGFTNRNIPYYLTVGYNTVINEPFDNITTTTAGWTIGNLANDNATGGKWIVAVPISSVTNGDTVQTGHDHSNGSGKCAVTGNAASAGNQPGSADVDGGRTTMVTQTYDLSLYNKPIVSYWRWFSNSQNPTNGGKDYWRVWASYDDGTSWVMVEKTLKPDVRWRKNVFIPDLTLGNKLKIMFTATDSAATTSGGTWVEAAVDDIEILELGSGSSVGVNDINGLQASVYPNPASNTITITTTENGSMKYAIVNTLGETVLADNKASVENNSLHINTASLANGMYFVKLEMNAKTSVHRLLISK